jgi:hypothetical protein
VIAGPTGPRKLTSDEREALRLLVGSPHGRSESIMMAHGCAIGVLRDLVRDGLVSEERRSTIAARRGMVVTWLRITEAGRLAIG